MLPIKLFKNAKNVYPKDAVKNSVSRIKDLQESIEAMNEIEKISI